MLKRRLFWTLFPSILIVATITSVFSSFYFHSVYQTHNMAYRTQLVEKKAELNSQALLKSYQNAQECPFNTQELQFLFLPLEGKPCGTLQVNEGELKDLYALPEKTLTERDPTRWWYSIPALPSRGTLIIELREPLPRPDFLGNDFFSKYALPGIVVTLLISYFFSRIITRPVERLEEGALRFATGDLKQRLAGSRWFELDSLSQSLNQMASQIDQKLRNLVQQSNEVKSVLSSMNEGVIAVDKHSRVMNMNRAAKDLLNLKKIRKRMKKPLKEFLGDSELNRATLISQQEGQFAMGDFILQEPSIKVLEYKITPLKNIKGNVVGSLIVLNDVTRLRHLENVRRDFVANVSHELRTPITSIQGFAETLVAGVPEEQSEKFLNIILRQSTRLMEIINDLTELAKLDQIEGTGQLVKQPTSIPTLFHQAIQTVLPFAEKKNIALEYEADPLLVTEINSNLIEQALVNLLSNSIKYSDPNKTVKVVATAQESQLTLQVIDEGFGIPTPHLKRIFERFYRIDKARSRDLGGTGLGLAIVNHIARAHGGAIEVSSEAGVGSRFTILLPHASKT